MKACLRLNLSGRGSDLGRPPRYPLLYPAAARSHGYIARAHCPRCSCSAALPRCPRIATVASPCRDARLPTRTASDARASSRFGRCGPPSAVLISRPATVCTVQRGEKESSWLAHPPAQPCHFPLFHSLCARRPFVPFPPRHDHPPVAAPVRRQT